MAKLPDGRYAFMLFQFLIGRLKTLQCPLFAQMPEFKFQFLIGRLKTRSNGTGVFHQNRFQFLIGRHKT